MVAQSWVCANAGSEGAQGRSESVARRWQQRVEWIGVEHRKEVHEEVQRHSSDRLTKKQSKDGELQLTH